MSIAFSILALIILGCVAAYAITTARMLASYSGATPTQTAFSVALCLLAALALIIPPLNSSGEVQISDVIEIFSASRSLINGEGYQITLNGISYPPRYGPAFALLGVAPFMGLGQVLGATDFPSLVAWARIGQCVALLTLLLAAIRVGLLLGAGRLVALLPIILLFFPALQYFALNQMVDPAVAALWLVIFAKLLSTNSLRPLETFQVGLMIGLLAAIRPTGYVLLFPTLWAVAKSSERVRSTLALSFPIVSGALITSLYNHSISGDYLRNGYNLWLALPHDSLGLVFNPRYLINNLRLLMGDGGVIFGIIVFALGIVVNTRRGGESALLARRLLLMASLCCFPLLALQLIYFYFSPRFFLPLVTILIVAGGALLLREYQSARPVSQRGVGLVVFSFVVALLSLRLGAERHIARHDVALISEAQSNLACDGVVVTSFNPLLVQELLTDMCSIQVVPLNRSVEYASKVFAEAPVNLPVSITDPFDHRLALAFSDQVAEIYPFTYSDAPDQFVPSAERPISFLVRDQREIPSQQLDGRTLRHPKDLLYILSPNQH